jgi:hypothetical protein
VKQYGFTTLKYKNGVLPPDEEIETFIALRKEFPKHRIRLDPNAAWTITTAVHNLPIGKDKPDETAGRNCRNVANVRFEL